METSTIPKGFIRIGDYVPKRAKETKPRKINWDLTAKVMPIAERLLENAGFSLPADVKIYCVDQARGMYHPRKRYLTVPSRVFRLEAEKPGYTVYYTAHELAHAHISCQYPGLREMHGALFMRTFKSLCPTNFQHYELAYKPRNAANAGIRVPNVK